MKLPKIKTVSGIIGACIAVVLMGLSLLFGLLYGDDENINVICIIGMILGFVIFIISVIAIAAALWQKKHPDAQVPVAATMQEVKETGSESSRLEEKKGKRIVAVVLLVVQIGMSIGNFFASTTNFVLTIAFIFECIPMVGAVILIYYDQKFRAPITKSLTLLRVWTIALIWVQPVLTFIAYLAANMMNSTVLGLWLGGCVFLIVATVLLYLDGKEEVLRRSEQNEPSEKFCSTQDCEEEEKDDR